VLSFDVRALNLDMLSTGKDEYAIGDLPCPPPARIVVQRAAFLDTRLELSVGGDRSSAFGRLPEARDFVGDPRILDDAVQRVARPFISETRPQSQIVQ